jgi:WD40-like Beta Propeller Repeat
MNRRGNSHVSGGRARASRVLRGVCAWTVVLALAPLFFTLACAAGGDGRDHTTSSTSGGAALQGTGGGGKGGEGQGGDIFGGPSSPFVVMPSEPGLTVELPLSGQTVQFTCVNTLTGLPAEGATWKLDATRLGTIDASGLYTPNGASTGTTLITCSKDGAAATTRLKLGLHAVDEIGLLSKDQKAVLTGAYGKADPMWKVLYPYDQTVFPRGVVVPEIHLSAGATAGSAFYVHVAVGNYEYEGFFVVSAASTQLQMSQPAWDALSRSARGQKVKVEIGKLCGGKKYGPLSTTWELSVGELHGTIYYNTYNSPLAQQSGAMLRIKGASSSPEVLLGNCTVCHSISADGSTAAAANHGGVGGTFDLSSGTANPPNLWEDRERAAFAALYPKNGEVLVTNGAPGDSWPPNTPGTSQSSYSELRTRSGVIIPKSGIESYYAMTPTFSPDGKRLAFNDRAATPKGLYWPSVLASMQYNAESQKFFDYRALATPPAGRQYAWPAFTPDSHYLVFQSGVGEDLATWNWLGSAGNTGKLYAIDVETKRLIALPRLNGDGYMPGGARDEDKNYEPTIAPVASGGYFWVMFTSRRTYGSKLTGSPDQTKRLWIAALDITASDGVDPSHPAFYLGGQELTSGNSRGFWALDPCKKDGLGCQAGDECCGGFCNPTADPEQSVCGASAGGCAGEFGACTSDADCCDLDLRCLGARCTLPTPPK